MRGTEERLSKVFFALLDPNRDNNILVYYRRLASKQYKASEQRTKITLKNGKKPQ